MKHTNTLYTNDNLYILNGLNSESVDLIYLDPPFNSKRTYSAPIGSKSAGASFKDMWTWEDVNEAYLERLVDSYPSLVKFIQSIQITHSKAMMAYITYMTQRLIELHRVLKSTGSIYLHCDPTASHYLKVVMDGIFGRDNFRNEIVWYYTNKLPDKRKKMFTRSSDTLLFYAKKNNDYFYFQWQEEKRDKPVKDRRIKKVNGKKVSVLGEDGQPIYDIYEYRSVDNIWKIPMLTGSNKERTGYPTQKPLSLLHRIIKASCPENGIVLDPFCGCATTCVASQQLQRQWIGIDIEEKASEILIERMHDVSGVFKDFVHRIDVPVRTDIKIEPITKPIKVSLYEAQEGTCKGCQTTFDIQHFEIDHIIPKSKGGGDYIQNYQLLCSNCNRVKGDRPMEFLRTKILARERLLKDQFTFGLA